MSIFPHSSQTENAFRRQLVLRSALLALLTAVVVGIAYQVRLPIKIAIGGNDQKNFNGFYYIQDSESHTYRWSQKDASVTFNGIGKAMPLDVTIVANAWRTPTWVYTSTVTLNGNVIGVIDRAGWRTWRFVVNNAAIIDPDHLVVEFHSAGFRPSEVYSDSSDERELGIAVESVSIEPGRNTPSSPATLLNLITIPSLPESAFVLAVVVAIYWAAQMLGWRERRAFYLSLAALASFAIGIVFFRLVASERVLILTLAVGVLAFAVTWIRVSRSRVADGQSMTNETTGSRLRTLAIVAGVAVVAFLLRFNALALLPIEGDDGLYMEVSAQYAHIIESGDWQQLVTFKPAVEHPVFYLLVNASTLVVRDAFKIPWSNTLTLRLVAATFGALQASLIAMLNPLAGWFLAVQTTEIKFTSMAYLEALPALAAMISIVAFERFRQTRKTMWLTISAVALGVAGASKTIYVTAGFAILPFLIWEQRRNWRHVLTFGLVAAFAFFALDPYLWYAPVARLLDWFSFHASFSTSGFAVTANRPWWYTLLVLAEPAKVYVPQYEYPPAFPLVLDLLIFVLGLAGLVSLSRRSLLYLAWLLAGAIFVSIWNAKWEQYALVIATPLCLAAGWGVADLMRWLNGRLPSTTSPISAANPSDMENC